MKITTYHYEIWVQSFNNQIKEIIKGYFQSKFHNKETAIFALRKNLYQKLHSKYKAYNLTIQSFVLV